MTHTYTQLLYHLVWSTKNRENIPYCQPFAWQEGYGAFSVSRSNIDVIVSYIQNQHRHHTKLSFRDEFLLMLRKHGIEFDERYLWK